MSGDPSRTISPTASWKTSSPRCRGSGGSSVIARNSTFIYKGRAVDVRQVGTRASASAMCSKAACAKPETGVRITAQLIDAATGAHLWARAFRRRARGHLRSSGPGHRKVVAIVEPRIQRPRSSARGESVEPEFVGADVQHGCHRSIRDRSAQRAACPASAHPEGPPARTIHRAASGHGTSPRRVRACTSNRRACFAR